MAVLLVSSAIVSVTQGGEPVSRVDLGASSFEQSMIMVEKPVNGIHFLAQSMVDGQLQQVDRCEMLDRCAHRVKKAYDCMYNPSEVSNVRPVMNSIGKIDALVSYDEAAKEIAIDYRGTDFKNKDTYDLATNGSGWLVDYKHGGKVHAGFYQRSQETIDQVEAEALKLVNKTGYNRVVISGHSLGAALALLVATELKIRHPEWDLKYNGFNGPRVFNETAAAVAEATLEQRNIVRINNDGDFVHRVGPEAGFGYRHVGTAVTLPKKYETVLWGALGANGKPTANHGHQNNLETVENEVVIPNGSETYVEKGEEQQSVSVGQYILNGLAKIENVVIEAPITALTNYVVAPAIDAIASAASTTYDALSSKYHQAKVEVNQFVDKVSDAYNAAKKSVWSYLGY